MEAVVVVECLFVVYIHNTDTFMNSIAACIGREHVT